MRTKILAKFEFSRAFLWLNFYAATSWPIRLHILNIGIQYFFARSIISRFNMRHPVHSYIPLIEVIKFWLWLPLIESKILSWWASYSSRFGNIFSTNWSKFGSGLRDLLETSFLRHVGHSLFPDLNAVTMHSAQNLKQKC